MKRKILFVIFTFSKKMASVTVSLCCLAFLSLTILSTDAYPQQKVFPEKSIEVIAAAAGSVGDLWLRSWGDEFAKLLNVPFVVVNKGGAMTSLIELSMAKPDGHTIAYFSYPQMIAWTQASKPPVDMFKDFSPLGAFGTYSALIAVEASSPFKTFEELIDYARKNPKKLKCASPGAHIHDHYIFELLMEHTKTDMVTVPFTGSSQVVTALLGKHVDLIVLAPAALVGHMKAGRIRPLITVQKLKEFPDIPLFSEKGLGEAGIVSPVSLIIWSTTPKEAQNKLIDALAKVAKDPKNIEKIEKLGFKGEYISPAEMWANLKKDYEKIRPIVDRLGLKEK
jgi:tripartite-type tricarboxylate transporter receptor subunit TctC